MEAEPVEPVEKNIYQSKPIENTPSQTFTFQKNYFVCFKENDLETMKITSYFILKALFILKIFKFLSRLFGHVGKTA